MNFMLVASPLSESFLCLCVRTKGATTKTNKSHLCPFKNLNNADRLYSECSVRPSLVVGNVSGIATSTPPPSSSFPPTFFPTLRISLRVRLGTILQPERAFHVTSDKLTMEVIKRAFPAPYLGRLLKCMFQNMFNCMRESVHPYVYRLCLPLWNLGWVSWGRYSVPKRVYWPWGTCICCILPRAAACKSIPRSSTAIFLIL